MVVSDRLQGRGIARRRGGFFQGVGDFSFCQVRPGLLKVLVLAVLAQVFQVSPDHPGAAGGDLVHHPGLVVGFSLALLDGHGPRGTVPHTGTDPLAHEIRYEPCLSVDDLQGTLMAIGDAVATADTEVLVDFDDFSYHDQRIPPVPACGP